MKKTRRRKEDLRELAVSSEEEARETTIGVVDARAIGSLGKKQRKSV
jgi:hypothetical protein